MQKGRLTIDRETSFRTATRTSPGRPSDPLSAERALLLSRGPTCFHIHHFAERQHLLLASAVGRMVPGMVALDRVQERRRAVALARHYRDEEGLSIAEIARRLGRAEATVKAYLYDPSDDNRGPSWKREAEAGGRELWSHLAATAPRRDVLPRRTFFRARLAVQHLR